MQFPWPEDEQRVRSRIRGLVDSVVRPEELERVRIEWVTPSQWSRPEDAWAALRITVSAVGDDYYEREVWGPAWHCSWSQALRQLAEELEDWVCETRFAWGQQRQAVVPD